jgi:hypothetical protein
MIYGLFNFFCVSEGGPLERVKMGPESGQRLEFLSSTIQVIISKVGRGISFAKDAAVKYGNRY